MSRPPLPIGAHGKITAQAVRKDGSDVWVASCRMNDVMRNKTVQVRRFGPTAEAARLAVEQEVAARRTAQPAPLPNAECETLKELMDWWWANSVTTPKMSASTLRVYRFAGAHLSAGEVGALTVSTGAIDNLRSEVAKLLPSTRIVRSALALIGIVTREYQASRSYWAAV